MGEFGNIWGLGEKGPEGKEGKTGAENNWRGTWKTATAYAKGDAVENKGSSYICIKTMSAEEDQEPPNIIFWNILAKEGKAGPTYTGQAPIKVSGTLVEIEKETITSGQIKPESIKAASLALAEITSSQIKAEGIKATSLALAELTTAQIKAEGIETASIKPLNITTGLLGTGAVTESKIAAESISSGKIKAATTPVPSAEENKIVLGTTGVARKSVAAITGNGILTKFKVVHNLGTRALISTILTESFEEPVTMLAKITSLTENEVEVTFTVALGAKSVNYLVLVG